MRTRIVVLAVVLGGPAEARVVPVPAPWIESHCQTGARWDAIEKCTSVAGTLSTVRTLPHAKLVKLSKKFDHQLYVYEEDPATRAWNRTPFRLLLDEGMHITDFARFRTLDGFHVDYATIGSQPTVGNDGITVDTATVFRTSALSCLGDVSCFARVTSCSAYVAGHAISTFRGSLVEDPTQQTAAVIGDAIAATGPCAI